MHISLIKLYGHRTTVDKIELNCILLTTHFSQITYRQKPKFLKKGRLIIGRRHSVYIVLENTYIKNYCRRSLFALKWDDHVIFLLALMARDFTHILTSIVSCLCWRVCDIFLHFCIIRFRVPSLYCTAICVLRWMNFEATYVYEIWRSYCRCICEEHLSSKWCIFFIMFLNNIQNYT